MKKSGIVKEKIAFAVILIIGILSTAFWGMLLIACIGDKELASEGFWQVASVFTIIGIALIVVAVLKKKFINKYVRYMSILSIDRNASMKTIAEQTNSTEEKVRKNIEKMISKNFFDFDVFTYEEKKFVTVQCQGCGAKNVVEEGKHQECEYCGSVLYGE